jgi:peptidoglycan hydrolase-like protein with peptidoglycan-binding domain
VKVFSLGGAYLAHFDAYSTGFHGGVHVASADVDNDGVAEIITGAGAGGAPHVRVFTVGGAVKAEWMAYDFAFPAGVQVGAGDLDGDGRAEVVTGPGPTGGPHVRVFNGTGGLRSEWMAYNPAFPGGVNVGIGNGRVITAPAGDGGPHVRVFSATGGVTSEWMAFDPGFEGGVTVAAGDVDGSPAVVTGAGPGGGPHVVVFTPSGAPRSGFFAYGQGFAGGVNVAVGAGRVVTGAGVARVAEVFRPGDRGAGVAGLQQRLLNMGYWLPGVDGAFGDTTTQAVYAFQKANGLPRDGSIGLEDQAALRRGARPSPHSTTGDLVEVDKGRQLLFVIRGGRMAWTFNTSTGSNGAYSSGGRTYRAITPEGRFTFDRQVDGTRVSHLGSLFRPKYFTSAGHAIHGSPSIPPYPASHGCVRLSNPAINFIWAANLAPLGSQIWVHA